MRPDVIGARGLGAVGGGAAVSVATDLHRLVDVLTEEGEARVGVVLDAELREAFRAAVAAWPVLTGRSRAELRFQRLDPLTWRVRADAPYSGRIRVDGREVVGPLLLDPSREAVRRAAMRVNRGE